MELVNDSGWKGARMAEILGDKYEKVSGALGDINPGGDSLIGQTLAVDAEDDLNIIEALGWLYSGFFISQAEGAPLDGIAERYDLQRNGLTRSEAYVIYLLSSGQTIAAGNDFTIKGTAGDWSINSEIVENGDLAVGFVFEVNASEIITGNNFTISIDGKPYSTQYQDGDTSETILDRLYASILQADSSMTTYATAYGNMIYSADGRTLVDFAYATDVFSVVKTAMPATAYYQSDTVFPVVMYGYVINDDILILADGLQGYLIEDDESFRIRILQAAAAGRVNVSASRPGIRNAILAVEGVTFASVDVNRGFETDANGVPGKSIHAFVAGGASDDIAQAIYDAAAAECGFYGDTFGTATDGTVTETVYFSRQSYQQIFVSVSGDVWDAETTGRPSDYVSIAKTTIWAYFEQLNVGQDVFAGQIYARLLMAFSTLTDVVVTIGTTANPTGSTVAISNGIVAVTDFTSITVA